MQYKNLKTFPGIKDAFHPKVQRGLDNIMRCVIDLVVQRKGQVSLQYIEAHTGLKKVGATITADVIRYMVKQGAVELRGNTVHGNVSKLTEILEQEKSLLPNNHNKIWSEDEFVILAEMKLDKKKNAEIANKLKRTEKSVQKHIMLLRKAYKLIPIIERHKVVRDFVSKPMTPNAKKA